MSADEAAGGRVGDEVPIGLLITIGPRPYSIAVVASAADGEATAAITTATMEAMRDGAGHG